MLKLTIEEQHLNSVLDAINQLVILKVSVSKRGSEIDLTITSNRPMNTQDAFKLGIVLQKVISIYDLKVIQQEIMNKYL